MGLGERFGWVIIGALVFYCAFIAATTKPAWQAVVLAVVGVVCWTIGFHTPKNRRRRP